ncbi:MAG: DNA repair protein RecO [Clostridia bacterium]|nr:DNA repair protein RecO [Clostridia bacterium]
MKEHKTQALCLRSVDYGEANKILTLFSADFGKLSAKVRSAKSPKSKLKQCSMPLCFGEYILVKSGDFYTVTGCTVEESFFASWSDVHRYSASQIVLEVLDRLSEAGSPEPENLVRAVRALQEINYSEVTPYLYATHFLINLLPQQGINVDEEDELPRKIAHIFNAYRNASIEELETLDFSMNDIIQSLTFVNIIYRDRLSEKFNSITESLKILNALL